MRTICVLFITSLLLSNKIYATDWDLFPFQQKMFFLENSNTRELDWYLLDSMANNGTSTTKYSRKYTSFHGLDSCTFQDLMANNYTSLSFNNDNPVHFDSLICKGDSMLYYSEFSADLFYFLPNAISG